MSKCLSTNVVQVESERLFRMNRRPFFELEVMGRKLRLGERTLIMGVLNTTPDSFSDGGLYADPAAAIARGIQMAKQGADWIDVGGESTRPGSSAVSAEEEMERVLPVIQGLRRKLGATPISIDTTKASVARQAVRAGANILNDVSGLRFDEDLAEVAALHRLPLVLMHLRGRPRNMQQRPFARSIWRSLQEGLATSIERALSRGVRRKQLILDPGLGFGKSRSQNYEILAQLSRLQSFRLPILVGSSRKSFVRAVVYGEDDLRRSERRKKAESAPALLPFGDAAGVVAAILNGAHIVRVHDVELMLPALRVADAIAAAVKPGQHY